jgi:hypothetical protein
MNEKEWAIQYTDERYLTKKELAQAMHTSLVDGYWLDVRNYRGRNAHPLPHRTISNQRFWLCLSPGVKAKIAAFEGQLSHIVGAIGKIDEEKQKAEVERTFLLRCLSAEASFAKIDISPLSLKALLNGTYHEDNPEHAPVIAYLATIRKFLAKKPMSPDADFLGLAYGSLLDQEELTTFYRTTDFDHTASRIRFMTGGDFHYAPFETVEPLMNEFFPFVFDVGVSVAPRAIGALYFLDLVKPFLEKNLELACLLAKAIVAKESGSPLAFLLPFEAILEPSPRYQSLYIETQHSGDLTYIVTYAIEAMAPLLLSLDEEIKRIRIEAYRNDMRPLSPSEEKIVKEPREPAQMSLLEEGPEPEPEEALKEPCAPEPVPEPEPRPVPQPFVAKTPPEKTPKPDAEEPRPVPEAPLTPLSVERAAPLVESASEETEVAERALSTPEVPLSDKEIKEYVQYLLESNPNLNKNQAAFLSSHCTMGHYYTIQQFKRATRCAYETARTSMDKLAKEGYYEKKQCKNKFVYTPVRQGGSK